ncbi:MAG: YerC/YecD family TrpR-related protein [Patescibacteria group bacterium]|nr:YerC/YecD family TrpR-related protein [Patescibacteria group bacterium]
MTQVSKYPISKNIADRIFEVFIKSLIKVKNDKDAEDLADDLFSPEEKIMLAKRLAIAFLLMKNYQYREIRDLLRVSLATIRKVSLCLNYGKDGYKKILGGIAKEEKLEDFFENMADKLLSIPAKSSKGGGAWRYLHNEVKNSKNKRHKAF